MKVVNQISQASFDKAYKRTMEKGIFADTTEEDWETFRTKMVKGYMDKDKAREPYRYFFRHEDWEELAKNKAILEKIKELQVIVGLCNEKS